ncbi:MAG: exosome complex protein Rrp42 [Euryarchaeota archaeon]|nr:exosome complex protein Rrp42 [Euryarchaeota archaeon]MDE1836165.1 exosome complex protein Rrp42 [Euryarchaeota archaeon]MDE1881020.1 exosome complex protein Rrp42 [Euryarchaeota archaeon]MDE2045472.1 exosome complex protein Rrp42 [Thermoplasmata archaeon]
MSGEVAAEIMTTHVLDLAKKGNRLDGRALDEMRPVKVQLGYVASADGSALAQIGNTKVLSGIKVEVGKPFPDTPNAGVLTTNAELVPLSSPMFEPGPPTVEAIETSRVVDRAIRAADMVDLASLCITPGEKAWVLYVDCHVLDHGGNLIDTAMLAASAALTHTNVPSKKFEVGEDRALNPKHVPIESTFVRLGDAIVVDPTREEEVACQGRLTIATDEVGNVVAMQKGKVGAFSPQDVTDLVDRAFAHGDRLREIIRKL